MSFLYLSQVRTHISMGLSCHLCICPKSGPKFSWASTMFSFLCLSQVRTQISMDLRCHFCIHPKSGPKFPWVSVDVISVLKSGPRFPWAYLGTISTLKKNISSRRITHVHVHIVIGYGCLTPLSTILFSYIIIVSISGGGKQITK